MSRTEKFAACMALLICGIVVYQIGNTNGRMTGTELCLRNLP